MNERIKQLVEQALNYAEKNQSADIPQHWFKLHTEKFAELIVRECATIADIEKSNLAGCGYITKTKGMLIKEHFGVSE
jgi:hypothetical protein